MPNEVTKVVVSVTVQPTGGRTPIIEIEEALVDGAGTLVESIFGGQVSYGLDLTAGEQKKPLSVGELVHVHGERNGRKFVIDMPLTTVSAKKPWVFSGRSGNTGP